MKRKSWGIAALLLMGLALPAKAQAPFIAFVGTVVIDSTTSECFPSNGGFTMVDEPDMPLTGIFIPGELNTSNGWTTSFSVRNNFNSFVANVPVDAATNPDGKLITNAAYDGIFLNPIGQVVRRRGRVLQVIVNPVYGASTSTMTMTVKLNNVMGLTGCTVGFRGVFSRVMQ